MKINFLNSKEKKNFIEVLKKNYEFKGKIEHYLFEKEEKYFIVNNEIGKILNAKDIKLNINSYGLYIGELRHENFRFSVEGAQIYGKECNKNIVEIDKEQTREWFNGNNVVLIKGQKAEDKTYVLIKYGDLFIGCGRIDERIIMNFLPKVRRIATNDFEMQ